MGNEIQAQLNQTFSQLQSIGGSSFGTFSVGGSSNDYINSVFGMVQEGQTIANGDDSQKASAIQGLITKAMSLIDMLTNQESKAANREVQNNKNAADRLKKEQEKTKAELNQNIDKIESEIINEKDTVINATNQIGDVSEKIQEEQEALNEIIQQIEAQQTLLANANPEEQAKILGTIQELSGQITGIITTISGYQEQVAGLSENVENAITNIETAKGNAVTVQENGEMQIVSLAQEGAKLATNNTATQVKGATNTAAGASLQATAEVASSNMFTAGTSAKLYRAASDQTSAGQTRTTGSITNLQTVMQGIGGLQDNLSLLNNFNIAIGSSLGEFNGAIGDWNTSLSPVITSFGSFDIINAGNEELKEAVTNDLSSLGQTTEANENENNGENVEGQPSFQTLEFNVQEKLNLFKKADI